MLIAKGGYEMKETIPICLIVLVVSMIVTVVASIEEDYFGSKELHHRNKHKEAK